jgi:hypothetical protein
VAAKSQYQDFNIQSSPKLQSEEGFTSRSLQLAGGLRSADGGERLEDFQRVNIQVDPNPGQVQTVPVNHAAEGDVAFRPDQQ